MRLSRVSLPRASFNHDTLNHGKNIGRNGEGERCEHFLYVTNGGMRKLDGNKFCICLIYVSILINAINANEK